MDRISNLILKKLKSGLTPEEADELHEWASQSPSRSELLKRLTSPRDIGDEYFRSRTVNSLRPFEDMQKRINHLRHRHAIRKWTPIAAAVLVIIALGAWWLAIPDIEKPSKKMQTAQAFSLEELTPGSTGAIYKGSHGRTVMLSASDTTTLANHIEDDRFFSSARGSQQLSLEVGRGREFKIVLEDSTVVWLNSESQLRYPDRFAADCRRVAVSGEAYFEVRPDKNRPFIVETGGQSIKVYGTTFNVRGYIDEEAVLTTLENGSVAISERHNPRAELFLQPGHQARYDRESSQVTMKEIDPEIVTGWRHGKFVFEETPLSTIMRDLSRWYDFKYEFADESLKDIVFMGAVSRYSDFRTIISILEDGGDVKFSVHDDKVIISKK